MYLQLLQKRNRIDFSLHVSDLRELVQLIPHVPEHAALTCGLSNSSTTRSPPWWPPSWSCAEACATVSGCGFEWLLTFSLLRHVHITTKHAPTACKKHRSCFNQSKKLARANNKKDLRKIRPNKYNTMIAHPLHTSQLPYNYKQGLHRQSQHLVVSWKSIKSQ